MNRTIGAALFIVCVMIVVASCDVNGDSPAGKSDAAGSTSCEPVPTCATDYPTPEDAKCGPLPCEFRHGCGCTDGVPVAVCSTAGWNCENGLTPRVRCEACSGPAPFDGGALDGLPTGFDAGGNGSCSPNPSCGTGFAPRPDPRCGPVPCEFSMGCGCTDGIYLAVCGANTWTCPNGIIPRARCQSCFGATDGGAAKAVPSDEVTP